ncbi:hypothetical protein Tco_1422378 [Tanacetum coccineum]
MAESSSQNTSSPKITPKDEPVTFDKPESPNPFLPASQVDFTFNEITFTTNNEVTILYPSHPNQDYFKTLDDSKVWIPSPTGGVRGEIGKKPGAKSRLKRKRSSKHTSESTTEASKSQTSQSKKETKSSLAKDKILSHPSPPTPMVGEIHKEAQQAAGGPTSLGPTSEEGAHPQLSSGHDALADSTAEVDLGISAPKDSISSKPGMDEGTKNYSFDHIFVGSNPSVLVDKTKNARDGLKTAHTDSGENEESRANDISLKVKLEDLSNILKDTRFAFFTPDFPPNEPIIVSDESEGEEEVAKDKDTEATSHDVPKDTLVPPPPSLKSTQIQELMAQLTELLVTSLKPKLSKLLASHDFASFLPPELKELPSKITGLSREIKELKKHVKDMEIELPMDLKEILTKLEIFTSTISSLLS